MKPSIPSLVAAAILAASATSAGAATLDQAVSAALANSPSLQAAEARIASARASIRQAKSFFYPSLGLSAAYSASDNPIQSFMMQLNQRTLIAAHALSRGLVLVTANVGEFQRVDGLRIENWQALEKH